MHTVKCFYFWLFVKIATREYIFKNILLHGNDTSGLFYNSKLISLSKDLFSFTTKPLLYPDKKKTPKSTFNMEDIMNTTLLSVVTSSRSYNKNDLILYSLC